MKSSVNQLLLSLQMLRKTIQKALDKLDIPFLQRATPAERSEEFQNWVSQLSKNSLSLPNEAFDRDNIYI